MMKRSAKKIGMALCLFFVLLSLEECIAEVVPSSAKTVSTGGGELIIKEPRLIARNVAHREPIFSGPSWCGSKALLFDVSYFGIEYIDLITKEKRRITRESRYTGVNCSPDGEWAFIYYDRRGLEEEKRQLEDPGPPYFIIDFSSSLDWLYRYNLKTGKMELVAEIEDFDSTPQWISPDGEKIFLGSDYTIVKEEGLFNLEPVKVTDRYWQIQTFSWFRDSSGIAAFLMYPLRLAVEVFGEEGWSATFDLEEKYGMHISNLSVDYRNRIYFLVSRYRERGGTDSTTLYRCEVDKNGMQCSPIKLSPNGLGSFDILPGGDILITENGCIRHYTPELFNKKAECLISPQEGGTLTIESLSPDKSLLAFYEKRNIKLESSSETYSVRDLYISELEWKDKKPSREK